VAGCYTRGVPPSRPVALTIAGSDSGGGAGIVADVKTFEAHGVWGAVALTAVTAQNTVGVQGVHVLPAPLVRAQIESVATDIGIDALKTGMLGTAEVVRSVARAVAELGLGPLVVDPVAVSSSGTALLGPEAMAALREKLVPLAALVTPNRAEAAALTGSPVEGPEGMVAAARALVDLGCRAALVTGGDLGEEAADCLVLAGSAQPTWLRGPRLAVRDTHGTGCLLSAAVCARLARGESLETACRGAKTWTAGAIRAGVRLGAGAGPVDPGWERSAARR